MKNIRKYMMLALVVVGAGNVCASQHHDDNQVDEQQKKNKALNHTKSSIRQAHSIQKQAEQEQGSLVNAAIASFLLLDFGGQKNFFQKIMPNVKDAIALTSTAADRTLAGDDLIEPIPRTCIQLVSLIALQQDDKYGFNDSLKASKALSKLGSNIQAMNNNNNNNSNHTRKPSIRVFQDNESDSEDESEDEQYDIESQDEEDEEEPNNSQVRVQTARKQGDKKNQSEQANQSFFKRLTNKRWFNPVATLVVAGVASAMTWLIAKTYFTK